MKEILINDVTKERISPVNYVDLNGTPEENILAGLIVTICISNKPISASRFIGIYRWAFVNLTKGFEIDYDMYYQLKNGTLAHGIGSFSLKNKKVNLMTADSLLKIARCISGDDEEFEKLLLSELCKSDYKHMFD